MDTKLKGNKRRVIAVLLVFAALAALFLTSFPYFYEKSQSALTGYYEDSYFLSTLSKSSVFAYHSLTEKRESKQINPTALFFPEAVAALDAQKEADEATLWPSEPSAPTSPPVPVTGETGEIYMTYTEVWENDNPQATLQEILSSFDERFYEEKNGGWYQWSDLQYLAMDDAGTLVSNGTALLQEAILAAGKDEFSDTLWEAIAEEYDYAAIVKYDSSGGAHAHTIYGAPLESLGYITQYDTSDVLYSLLADAYSSRGYDFDKSSFSYTPKRPGNMTVLYAVPKGIIGSASPLMNRYTYNNTLGSQLLSMQVYTWEGNSLFILFLISLAAAALLLGLILGVRKKTQFAVFGRMSLEISVLVILLPLSLIANQIFPALGVIAGRQQWQFFEYTLVGESVEIAAYGCVFLLMFAGLLCLFFGVYSLCQVVNLGFLPYLKERSLIVGCLCSLFTWTGKLCRALYRGVRGVCRKVYHWATNIDLTKSSTKFICRILIINFIITAVLCCMWFVGIIFLILYSFVLFFLMRKYTDALTKKYQTLLNVAAGMSEGQFDAVIKGDLGAFSALGDSLLSIQDGFEKAVVAETKSQKMKAELVTNVSHDLKTPLTAIITYVDLLKTKDLSEEIRENYIDILDRKSKQLSHLIEDVFAISQANTGSMTLTLADVDLVALLQQVEQMDETEIKHCGVEFRHKWPETRVLLTLDGEKCSRIFENLLLNVTKYALPGTRAYIDVSYTHECAVVEIKNISKEPMDFNTEDISERFVRGDKSRNTEGNGLGLAIARSFTEAQGGTLTLVTDGDLFKVRISFPR